MILLAGIPSEPPMAMVRRALTEIGAPHVMWNQRDVTESDLELSVTHGHAVGRLTTRGGSWDLAEFDAIFPRMMDAARLPELESAGPGTDVWTHGHQVHELLAGWIEVAPGRVVNRAAPQGSNGSKPFQSQLIRDAGLRVPETLITNDPAAVVDFLARHRRLVYKSISGVRSIVRTLDRTSMERLERIRWCPVQFQAFCEGVNVRVHTIGATGVFATIIRSGEVDYRYGPGDDPPQLTAFDLPDGLARTCLELSARLGLHLAGIDLKMASSGDVWCLEVNPSPAFSYYEARTGQSIAAAIARYLCGQTEAHPALREARLAA